MPAETQTENPYSPPDQNGAARDQASANAGVSIVPHFIAVADLLLSTTLAWMTIDYPLVSFVIIGTTWPIAFGLFKLRPWGWWAAMVLHCLILAVGTVAYVVVMILLVRDFGAPPNHMALITNEGFAVILTIVFAVAALVATIPVFALRSRNCRVACGV